MIFLRENNYLIVFEIVRSDQGMTLDKFIEEEIPGEIISKESLTIDENIVVKVVRDLSAIGGGKMISVIIPTDQLNLPIIKEYRKNEILKNESFFLVISGDKTPVAEKTLNQILSTFRFLD